MCDLGKILEAMEQKRQLLRSVEEVTQEMITCESVKLEELMTRRGQLVEALEKTDREMKELCRDQEDGPAVLDAAICKGDADRYAGAMAAIYRSAQGQRAILSRLRDSELQAILRLKQEQLEILDKIKSTNQGGAAKAARFFSVGSAGGNGGFSRLGRA